ncbi:hypothetical protein C0989_000509 [Termitomyces sp. Mn162]|nr:hypothetical protein C0989_000509 [Termitomyces sp. Mn162]
MPDIVKVREIVKSGDPLDWEIVWQANLTPWDAGESQPPLREVIESGGINFPRQGRVLVPGCGPGYDVFYLASALNMDVLGLDVSETAITKAKSFFIVIPPTRRTEWAQQMASLIKPQGYLITLVFPIDPPTDLGPPFFVRVEHYEEVLDGSFKKVLEKAPTTSLPSHVGKERIVVWERI